MHFDQNKTVGALGTLIVAKWYRAYHPRHLLVSLDSAETRRWMNLDDDARRADLLGLSVENNQPYLDILESKSGDDATRVYSIDADRRIIGKPVEQLLNTGRSVGAIFGLNEWKDHVLTPPRREILRNHLYRQGFSGQKTREEKQGWGAILNGLFSLELRPTIRLHLIVVNLGLNQELLDEVVESAGGPIRLVHLNEQSVSVHLGSPPLPAGDERGVVDRAPAPETERIEPEAMTVSEPDAPTATPSELRDQIRATCGRIKAACQDFGIRVTEIPPDEVDIGPSVLRYKIRLAPGEDGAKLRRQAVNIARQLAASSVPIIGFLPGTNYEYLDLARPDRQIVNIEAELDGFQARDVNDLPLLVGIDPAGQKYRLDLGDDRLPHLLVAGGTGSGKTIFLYSVVLSLVRAHGPKSLELVIVDPKQTDFTVFAGLPHLRGEEVITDAGRGVECVEAIAEHDMQERSETLQAAKCRDIKVFNLAHARKIIRPLVIVIDEYADLVSVLAKKEREAFERVISRITARGRNVGIHLVLATQRPTADIVTGNIKANMACRVSFSLPSGRDSQVILDETGAERLLRNGDMLLMLEGKLTRLQGYYVDPARIELLLNPRRTK